VVAQCSKRLTDEFFIDVGTVNLGARPDCRDAQAVTEGAISFGSIPASSLGREMAGRGSSDRANEIRGPGDHDQNDRDDAGDARADHGVATRGDRPVRQGWSSQPCDEQNKQWDLRRDPRRASNVLFLWSG
jgi:hypothetical protein